MVIHDGLLHANLAHLLHLMLKGQILHLRELLLALLQRLCTSGGRTVGHWVVARRRGIVDLVLSLVTNSGELVVDRLLILVPAGARLKLLGLKGDGDVE